MRALLTFITMVVTTALVHDQRGGIASMARRSLIRLRGGTTASEEPTEAPWDYIIIGGGAAGCVLADRLSAEPDARVLVLEAGTDARSDLRIRIPAALIKVFKSERDWDFNTEPDADTRGRSVYLCRGKALGGSSCTNVMLYHRGTAADYDKWLDAGADGWGPAEVLDYYRKAEHSLDGASQYHGVGGPMPVDDVPYVNELSEAFLAAAGELGYRRNRDFNDWSSPQDGFGRFKVTQRSGERCSAANGYLEGAEGRSNLCVRTSVHVTKVALDGEGDDLCACGVEYIGEDGKACRAALASGGEVLLSAGAVQSPQLLMLSGIGPRSHLEERGIRVCKALEGVGEGLQDHPAVLVSYGSKKAVSVTDEIRLLGSSLPNPLTLLRWMLFKRGALTSVACEFGGFFRTSDELQQPDLQIRFVAARSESADGISTLQKLGNGHRFRSGYTTQIIACRPHSKGRVRLRNADPLCKPLLEKVHLSSEEDVATLRDGIKLGRKLCCASSFDSYRTDEVYPSAAVQSDEEIDEYIRASVHSANALTGSCRMGRETDAGAVLDSQMRVRGVGSLRVVDASAMPCLVGGQTCAPTIMMAEKAADMLLTQRAEMRRYAAQAHEAYTAQATEAQLNEAQAAYLAAAEAQGMQGAAA